MATRVVFTPLSAEMPNSNYAALIAINFHPVLAFDPTTAESCFWTFIAPQGMAGTKTLVISWMMASATTGGIAFTAELEAITAGDATDLDATTSFAAVNTGTDATMPTVAGYMKQMTITLTNDDAITPGDLVRLRLTRAVANATDTALGDCYVLMAELRDTV